MPAVVATKGLEATKLTKKAIRTWTSPRTPEAAERYRVGRRTVALVAADATAWACEKFRKAMETDFWLVSRRFWQTVEQLRKRKWFLSQNVLVFSG